MYILYFNYPMIPGPDAGYLKQIKNNI